MGTAAIGSITTDFGSGSTSTYILLKAAVIAAYYSLWSTAKGTGSAFGISLQRMKGMGFALLL